MPLIHSLMHHTEFDKNGSWLFSVRRKWAVQEDEALAYRLQDEESKFALIRKQ